MNSIENVIKFFEILKEYYANVQLDDGRKKNFTEKIDKYGYLPYPYIKVLNELSDAEVFFCLTKKLEKEGVMLDGTIIPVKISPLERYNITEPDWIKRECHDIKLINLAALGNGNKKEVVPTFMNWLRQLVIMPTGNVSKGILNTTIYLTPFHPRGFGCAYIPQSSSASSRLEDMLIKKLTGLNADEQVKMFISLAQLTGHPVIYDILPQTGRFSKIVLANPFCVRWIDVNALIDKICSELDKVFENSLNPVLSQELISKYSKELLTQAISVYKKFIRGERRFAVNSQIKDIIKEIDNDTKLLEYKKNISDEMQRYEKQKELQQRVRAVVKKTAGLNSENINETDIKNRREIEIALLREGLWSQPGGAWNSAGVPVFDKMAKDGLYPKMRHYNYNNEDVTQFANLDCQSPFYFIRLENGTYNEDVVDFYVNYIKNLVKEFNFDGVRIDHVNHVIDDLSLQNGMPISYRIPDKVLKKLNDTLKEVPYFVSLAEYMLRNEYYKEYHEDMNFDILYGNDIVYQYLKTPFVIDTENRQLALYNKGLDNIPFVSVLKIYNNQDGEYKFINQYPGQLGEEGALFKWFKYKLMPGGYYAQRPVMYIDGDESFTKTGIQETIVSETCMNRNNNLEFFRKFDAIDRFAKNNNIVCYGEAHILEQDLEGFVVWQLQADTPDDLIIVVANYKSPTELFAKENSSTPGGEFKNGEKVSDKTVQLHDGFKFVSEYRFNGEDYVAEELDAPVECMHFDELQPAEFRFFSVKKI